VILAFIHSHRERFGVEPICRVLSEHGITIAPQTYHRWRVQVVRPEEIEEAYRVNRIVDLYRVNRSVYGVRKLWRAARRAGMDVGRDQVGRYMRIAGIQGVRRGQHKTRTTTRDQTATRHPDLVKRAWTSPTKPDALWVADFTYVWTAAGFVYVSFITDVFSRRILGWKASADKKEHLVLDALRMALATRRRTSSQFTSHGIIHHSDAGSQYTAIALSEELEKERMLGSIGTVGDALDNALMESTIGLYKTELINERLTGRNWSGLREVERETASWVHWYNTERLHSSIEYLTPLEREIQYANDVTKLAKAS
jgi:transposase InsO family protein